MREAVEAGTTGFIARPTRRLEDADLLLGRGRFADDLPVRTDTLHAAILRSPHAHAEIRSIYTAGALALPGVDCVVTGEDARRWTRPFAVAVKTAMEQWCLATDRVRYVGEPVAVVLARDRYTAADALELIEVSYRPLPAVIATPSRRPALLRRYCILRSGATSSATARSATAIPKPLLPPRHTGSRSRPLTRAIPAARSRGLW
jgi:xanthine dehydrogenase molybdopterin-binding subunit B